MPIGGARSWRPANLANLSARTIWKINKYYRCQLSKPRVLFVCIQILNQSNGEVFLRHMDIQELRDSF